MTDTYDKAMLIIMWTGLLYFSFIAGHIWYSTEVSFLSKLEISMWLFFSYIALQEFTNIVYDYEVENRV